MCVSKYVQLYLLTTTDLYLLPTCAKCLPCLYVSALLWFIPPRHPVTIIEALFFSSSSSALSYLYCQGRDSVGLAKLDFYLLLSKLFFLSLSSIRSAFVQLCCQRAVQTSKFQCPCMIYVLFMTAIRCSYPLYPSTDQLILNSRRQNLNWIW